MMFIVNKSSLNPEKVYECKEDMKEILVSQGFMPISSYVDEEDIIWLFSKTEELLRVLKGVNLA